jgi:hypothetical protein
MKVAGKKCLRFDEGSFILAAILTEIVLTEAK